MKKRCSKCGVIKVVSEFPTCKSKIHPNKRVCNGRICRSCTSKHRKLFRKSHPDLIKSQEKERYIKRRGTEKYINYKSEYKERNNLALKIYASLKQLSEYVYLERKNICNYCQEPFTQKGRGHQKNFCCRAHYLKYYYTYKGGAHKNLVASYIKQLFKDQGCQNPTDEMIELKRNTIKLKRALYEKSRQVKSQGNHGSLINVFSGVDPDRNHR